MSTNTRKELWENEGITDKEQARKALEAFYLLHGHTMLKKHFTEESDEERIKVLITWRRDVWDLLSLVDEDPEEGETLEIHRLSFELGVLEYYRFVSTEPVT